MALATLALAACAAPVAAPSPSPVAPTATVVPPTAAATTQPTAARPAPVPATSVALSTYPVDIAFDLDGNLYLTQCVGGLTSGTMPLIKIDTLGMLTSYASPVPGFLGDAGPVRSAEISCANGIAFDRDGNLFVADWGNNRVRRIDRNGIINTVAGSGPTGIGAGGFGGDGGPATSALLNGPTDVAFDPAGNLYIEDGGNLRIRRVDPQGIITTFAGNGTAGFSGDGGQATAAEFNPDLTTWADLTTDAQGNVYIADALNARVRKVDKHGIITTIAGNGGPAVSGDGGPATAAALSAPTVLAFDVEGNLYIADVHSALITDSRIRKIDRQGIITTVAGTGALDFSGDGGPATAAAIRDPSGIAFDRQGNLYFVDLGNQRVRRVDKNGIITTVVGGQP